MPSILLSLTYNLISLKGPLTVWVLVLIINGICLPIPCLAVFQSQVSLKIESFKPGFFCCSIWLILLYFSNLFLLENTLQKKIQWKVIFPHIADFQLPLWGTSFLYASQRYYMDSKSCCDSTYVFLKTTTLCKITQ